MIFHRSAGQKIKLLHSLFIIGDIIINLAADLLFIHSAKYLILLFTSQPPTEHSSLLQVPHDTAWGQKHVCVCV